MKKFAAALLCLLLMTSNAWAGEKVHTDLPQMVPVTFPDTYQNAVLPEKGSDNYLPDPACYGADGLSYHDDSLDIQIHNIHVYDTDVSVAFVQVASASQLRVEQAKPYPSKTTIRPIKLVERVNAVLAVNGDWLTYQNMGIAYRDGELIRERPMKEKDGLIIDANGDFHLARPMIWYEYKKVTTPIINSFVFGPALVMDGEVLEIDRSLTYRQRNGIGQIAPLSYVFVITDGTKDDASGGLSVPQLAQLMHDLGAHTAYNMDGGQSAVMYLNQQLIMGPEKIRDVGDIVYFATAVPSAAE